MAPDRLIFVYNADSGIASALIDALHKTLSPSTYPCSLCAITYGSVRMDPRWKAWLAGQLFATEFWHRDDQPASLPRAALPVVFAETAGVVTQLIAAERLATLTSVDALIEEIEKSL